MNERLTLTDHRSVKPIATFLMVIAFAAALALGFGLRAWTENTSAPSGTDRAAHVLHQAPAQPLVRLGKPW